MDSWPGESGCVIAGRGWAARLIQALLGQLNPKRRWGGGGLHVWELEKLTGNRSVREVL